MRTKEEASELVQEIIQKWTAFERKGVDADWWKLKICDAALYERMGKWTVASVLPGAYIRRLGENPGFHAQRINEPLRAAIGDAYRLDATYGTYFIYRPA